MKTPYILLISILLFGLFSCQSDEKPTTTNNETATTETIKTVYVNNDEELVALADSLNLEEEKYTELMDEKHEGDKKTELYYLKIHDQQSEIDSLNSIVNGLTVVNQVLNENYEKPAFTDEENAIHKMVFMMHDSWKSLPKTKNAEEILQYFNPKFMVSRIVIEADNTAQVAKYTHEDFKGYIKNEVIKKKGLSYEFGNVNFLDIEIKEHAYFNVAYKCILRTYQNHKLIETNSLLVTITGKKIDGKWGIASYSWVAFKYRK